MPRCIETSTDIAFNRDLVYGTSVFCSPLCPTTFKSGAGAASSVYDTVGSRTPLNCYVQWLRTIWSVDAGALRHIYRFRSRNRKPLLLNLSHSPTDSDFYVLRTLFIGFAGISSDC